MNHTNQYRFYLESANRLTIKYNSSDFIFSHNSLGTSNQLNTLIGLGLDNTQYNDELTNSHNVVANKTAKLKFKIPCVGYYNTDCNEILPEFFMNTYTSNGITSYHMSSNLIVDSNLYVADDITAFSTYYTSDKNLKHDITNLNNCYDIVSNLNPVGFKWIKNNEESVGFIAQEVEKIIPAIVKTDNNNYKVLAETKIITYLVGAIQELDKELRELEASL
jgi:hypothetical protein